MNITGKALKTFSQIIDTNPMCLYLSFSSTDATYFGAAIALFPFFRASSNLRTITSHFVTWQICFEPAFTASENKESPAARSTASTKDDASVAFLSL